MKKEISICANKEYSVKGKKHLFGILKAKKEQDSWVESNMLLEDLLKNFKGIRNVYFEDLEGLREED